MLLSLFLSFLAPGQEPAPETTAPERLDLLPHAELSVALHALADAHPNLAQVHLVGRSREGLAIEALALAGPGADEGAKSRPAILLVANLEGPRVFTSAVALHHARALVEGYASDEKTKAFLDTTTLYVVPRANPDAAEARFRSPREERRASGPGVDDDRDGRNGEDPPADLNGDNLVTWIREEDPSPTNPLGVKGAGEDGIVAAGGAIANAVADALAPLGVEIRSLPLRPSRLRALIQSAAARGNATS